MTGADHRDDPEQAPGMAGAGLADEPAGGLSWSWEPGQPATPAPAPGDADAAEQIGKG
jgi:hypothetical protein